MKFGTEEHLAKIQDVDIKGPNGEELYLGYKYSFHSFVAPYHLTDDGYILGIRGHDRFFRLDDAMIKGYQGRGLLPTPLPPYQLSAWDYFFGYLAWWILLFVVGSFAFTMVGSRRRKRALPHFNSAIAHHQAGNLEGAIDDYTRAIETDPKFAMAFNFRGNAYEAKGDTGKAIADYTKAIKIEPKEVKALVDRGILMRNQGQFDTAISDFDKLVKLTKDADAHLHRGYTYLTKGDADRALTDFTMAIKKAPEYAEAYRYRALAYDKKDEAALAEADRDKAKTIDSVNAGQQPA